MLNLFRSQTTSTTSTSTGNCNGSDGGNDDGSGHRSASGHAASPPSPPPLTRSRLVAVLQLPWLECSSWSSRCRDPPGRRSRNRHSRVHGASSLTNTNGRHSSISGVSRPATRNEPSEVAIDLEVLARRARFGARCPRGRRNSLWSASS